MDTTDLIPAALEQQVALLGAPDYRMAGRAYDALVAAGEAGLAAVIRGLAHPVPRVRRGCADFMDHQADERCVAVLCETARHDAVPAVRRAAVHALGCQRCKPLPLPADLVALLLHCALHDESMRVRQEAVYGLGQQPPDARAVAALRGILQRETHAVLRRIAHHALKRQDPAYRRAVDERAREQGQARARMAACDGSAPLRQESAALVANAHGSK